MDLLSKVLKRHGVTMAATLLVFGGFLIYAKMHLDRDSSVVVDEAVVTGMKERGKNRRYDVQVGLHNRNESAAFEVNAVVEMGADVPCANGAGGAKLRCFQGVAQAELNLTLPPGETLNTHVFIDVDKNSLIRLAPFLEQPRPRVTLKTIRRA